MAMAASSSSPSTLSLPDAVSSCLSAEHDIPAITEVLAEEPFLGSATDVLDAVGHLLGEDDDAAAQSAVALFEALQTVSQRKRPRLSASAAVGGGLAQLEWKREYMSDEARFELPYSHSLEDGPTLVLQQAPFRPEGFASTVWDSSIVLARFLELHAADYRGRRCIELGAGCGLPGLVLHSLGADVTLTDLEGNLPLLEINARGNAHRRGIDGGGGGGSHGGDESSGVEADGSSRASGGGGSASAHTSSAARVVELRWSAPPLPLALDALRPFNLILATDVLYSHDAVTPLVATLVELAAESDPPAEVLIAAGRNRHAGTAFFDEVGEHFDVVTLARHQLHPTYRCEDVDVWRLTLRPRHTATARTAAAEPTPPLAEGNAPQPTKVRPCHAALLTRAPLAPSPH
jgi:predicted nicotinamide N-methyase